jgi:2,5-diketo-D-gluconate reductase B
VALSWLLSKESVSAIPKSATREHIRENVRALEVTLDAEDIERIDDIDREKRYVDFEEAPWN